MGYLEGLIGGFSARKSEIEAQTLEESRLAQGREARIYEALINSPDKETRDLAIAGLLESARPRKRAGGLRGWMGELEQSPYLAQIQALSPEVEETETIRGPQEMRGYLPAPPPAQQAAALPPTSPTEVGAPPPTPLQTQLQTVERGTPITSDVRAGQAAGPVIAARTVSRPRQVFQTGYQRAAEAVAGQYGGRVEGIIQGIEARSGRKLTPEEVKQIGLSGYSSYGVGGAPFQAIAGETIDPDGTVRSTYATFNRATKAWEDVAGTPLTNFRQRPTGAAATSLGIYAERAARQLGYPTANAAGMAGPKAMRRVNDLAEQMQAEAGGAATTARGEAAAKIPLSTTQRFQAYRDLQSDWRRAEAPRHEMDRQLSIMETGLRRFKEGDALGGPQAVLIGFQRMLEPTSVVMPSEYARTPEGLSLIQRVQGYYDKWFKTGGAGIPVAELEEMVETARQFQAGLREWNTVERQRIGGLARQNGLDESMIFGGGVGAAPPSPTVLAAPDGEPTVSAGSGHAQQSGRLLFNGPDGKLHYDSPTGPLLPDQ